MKINAAVAGLLLCCSACSSKEDLTCEILSDPGNCWADKALAARACLPPATEVGVLAADRASCLYADGTRIVFDTPLPVDSFDLERLAFTIETGGAMCARFVDTFANRMELTAGGGTVVSELHAGSTFHLHCDDGTTYSSSFELLFTCPGGTAPTDGFSVEADLVTFSISAVTTPGELFRCAP